MRLNSAEVQRAVAIAVASLLVISIASVGQIQAEIDKDKQHHVAAARQQLEAGTSTTSVEGTTSTVALNGGTPVTGKKAATTTIVAGKQGVPDFGLKTQGVTATNVRIGLSYNVSGCGDAGPLNAMFGAAVTGTPANAISAFNRYVNDTGGIGGRTLSVDVVDDGGGGCPEKELAAARSMADDKKDFLVIPGLYTVADYVISKKVPVFGGRDDPASIAKIAPNGIMLTEPLDPTFQAWAAFGKYYLLTGQHKACLVHPTSDESGDWNNYEKVLVKRMRDVGLAFTDILVYQNDLSTAQTQASTGVTRLKAKGCDQVWLLSGNPIAWIFFTQAATQNGWHPTWTFTSYSALADSDLAGSLMDQDQWAHAIGLSSRVPPHQTPADGHCAAVYKRYYPNDGASTSAATQLACAQILSVAEIMRRAVTRTGVLTGNSLLVGADSVKNDFYYDSHVPITWSFPGVAGPFKTKGWSHMTVVKWNRGTTTYDFPEWPLYWKAMGPNKTNGEDLRPLWANYKPS